ncbi:pyridoxamine 5'-phosphate oxidase family protein [Cyclobacterium sp. SYSU L10401]|uniref:pyridoxamine 5'-phosphate oxidase family protein n=1 Tax=Cyclobacterium sp. SYSU L10401 TaxID=2678657 RepID=UPI0013D2DA9E|nr:pyridoxamine 5'-phosphate oxidase family protein [Cyclobacterium sp. SYSU L10401]
MLFKDSDALRDVWAAVRHEWHRATLDHKHPFRFVSLATLSGDQPDVRYLVLREMDEQHRFYCYTDSRSQKIVQLRENPALSLLFYHPKKRCQVKVQGTANIHQQNKLSRRHWDKVQGEAQKAYQASLHPGEEIDGPTEAHSWEAEQGDDHFVVLEIQPKTVDCLQLNGLSHLRAVFKLEGNSWTAQWLAP